MASKKKTPTASPADPSPPPAALDPAPEAADVSTVDVSDETLDATPARLLDFLRGVGTRPEIQAALGAVGYDHAEHQHGWKLLHACSGFAPSESAPQVDRAVADAINLLDSRDERAHSLADATLKHRAPSAHKALLGGVSPGRGAESVVYFSQLLDRLDALHAGTLDGVSAKDARTALDVLERRGFTAEWRSEHRALVRAAERFAGAPPKAAAETQGTLTQHLRNARAFFEEWSRIARTELKRKDHLILLGLATRKAPSKPAPAKPVPVG